jgi:hypothetical protein
MMNLRTATEALARKTTRRGLFGRGAEVAFGALLGAAAGSGLRARGARAGVGSVCTFPGRPCPCEGCQPNAVCAKPCLIDTTFYPSGCWVDVGSVMCCDCNCGGRLPNAPGFFDCGCGTDFIQANCP